MKKFAVIVAGGSGTRMKSSIPKQFLLLHGKPLLWYTVQAFLQAYEDIHVILVLPAAHIHSDVILSLSDKVAITTGGETRYHSVQNGLRQVKENSLVFV